MSAFTAHSRKTKVRAAAALTLAVVLLAVGLELTGLLNPYQLKTLDLFFRHLPLAPPSPQVVVATVDQPDLDFFKNQGVTWPWPRQIYGHIIDFCRRAGARAVIMDILFTETSRCGPEDDERLAEAVQAAGGVVLPFFLSRAEKPSPQAAAVLEKAALPISGPPPPGLPPYQSVLAPVPLLLAAAWSLGNVECQPDSDGIYRRVPLVTQFQGRWLPLLGFAAWQATQEPGPLRFEEGELVVGSRRLPLDREGRFLVKFRGLNGRHQRFPAVNLIQSDYRQRHGQPPLVPPEALAGKYVLVGLTAPGLLDLKGCPVSAVYPGVEVHATLLDNLLQGDFLRPVPRGPWWVWTLVLTGLMVGTVLFSPSLTAGLAVMPVLNFLNLGLCALAFRFSWWADPILPLFALNLGFALSEAYSYATEGRQKLAIRRMFSQYMSEAVISHLLQHPEKLKLGGERRRVTLFFSDLAGFTTISERLEEPERLVALLNDYLSRMTEIILDEAGTVDKYEGDAIMAFWGAPLDREDQALRACCAALRQWQALPELNRYLAGLNLPPLSMRIGLNTGDAVVGNLGSQKRFDYTVIGDTVNLASRLEGLNKFYGTHLMASEATVQECGAEVEFRELDWVAVKGKEKPVAVFEILARRGDLTPARAAAREAFAQGLQLYRAAQFPEAAAAFSNALEHLPGDPPSQVFLDRCRKFQIAPPPSNWGAVFRPEGK